MKIGTAVATPGSFLAVLRRNGTAAPVAAPLATLAAGGNHHALVVPYYRTGVAKPSSRPLDTVTTRERFALAVPKFTVPESAEISVDVEDCRVRMLQPREHLRSQRIGDSYIVTGNKGEQTAQAGNAVSANVAQWIGERLAAALDGAAAQAPDWVRGPGPVMA